MIEKNRELLGSVHSVGKWAKMSRIQLIFDYVNNYLLSDPNRFFKKFRAWTDLQNHLFWLLSRVNSKPTNQRSSFSFMFWLKLRIWRKCLKSRNHICNIVPTRLFCWFSYTVLIGIVLGNRSRFLGEFFDCPGSERESFGFGGLSWWLGSSS